MAPAPSSLSEPCRPWNRRRGRGAANVLGSRGRAHDVVTDRLMLGQEDRRLRGMAGIALHELPAEDAKIPAAIADEQHELPDESLPIGLLRRADSCSVGDDVRLPVHANDLAESRDIDRAEERIRTVSSGEQDDGRSCDAAGDVVGARDWIVRRARSRSRLICALVAARDAARARRSPASPSRSSTPSPKRSPCRRT